MRVFLAVLVIFASAYQPVFGAKVLAIVPTPSYSHQVSLWPIWKALAQRGHAVTLITTDPDWSFKGIEQIDIGFLYDLMNAYDLTGNITKNYNNFFAMMDLYMEMGLVAHEAILANRDVQKLLKNDSERFDVVLCEPWDSSVLGIVHRFKAPFIGVSSLDATIQSHECFGNPTNPALYPEMLLPFSGELSFFERVISSLYPIFSWHLFGKIHLLEDKLVEKYIGEGYPTISRLICSMDMMFLNVNPVFQSVRPLVPGTIAIGGGLHIQKGEPLPSDLQDYLDSSKEGVIYFSLGSNVKSKDLTPQVKSVIIETFSELPYKVLWKFEADELPGKPDNVKIVKWLPQQDVLRHPNIKVFITQGGLQSIDEAIYNHIPMVGIPFFGDQQNNVKKLIHKGIALSIDHFTIEKESFKATILEVINNPKYKNTITELAELALDQPMTGVEKAVWWTEYVIRHKGAKHLKSHAADLPLYQYFLLDVIAVIALVLATISFVVYKSTKCAFKLIKRAFCSLTKKQKTN